MPKRGAGHLGDGKFDDKRFQYWLQSDWLRSVNGIGDAIESFTKEEVGVAVITELSQYDPCCYNFSANG
jgi:hypothetical protein